MWRSLSDLFLASLRIVLRPDVFWFRPWATYTFRMLPLIGFMAAIELLLVPVSLVARLPQRSSAGSGAGTA